MIRYEIYPQEQKPIEIDHVVRVRLRELADGITVAAVDENGEYIGGGNLVELMNTGQLYRYSAVKDGLGFETDSNGKIKLAYE